ncbi:uncharacterized protein BDW43DRAFT_213866 [Aspergillus alliaceus]|uniref:uncharacterized protein n=1 Tax=Petromyces alliaceus TaxID=209559 RepID=UPI0012A67526|nr:uncharacterized protein BDW43DRAFT_213866 [Aspergillus alliaceus]KAB8228562.1 hypothetical protein BDW43DRAFT_213866 [Aspergillus alliaceus]
MYSTTLHPSPVKDGRRILGEKTANACLSPAHHRHDVSPSKRSLLEASSPKKLLPSPLFVGQKRTIDQVDDGQGNNGNAQAQHGESRAETQTVHDVYEEARMHSTTQKDDWPCHQQADATGPDVDQSRESNKQQSQQPQSPTQTTGLAECSAQKSETGPVRPVPEDPETRKLFIQEKASLLRNRIQSAMRHVRDPQFDRRLSELEAHSRKFPRLSLPGTVAPSHQKEAVTPRRQDEEAIPSTTPRPFQSALEFKSSAESSSIPLGLSSPPLSTGNDGSQDHMKTPTQRSHRRTGTAGSPMQLSSPPATISRTGRDRMVGEVDEQDVGEGNLPEKQAVTPTQRGDAVDGLLKLMNTGDKRENANAWTG